MNTGDAIPLSPNEYQERDVGILGVETIIYDPYVDAISLSMSDRMGADLDDRLDVLLDEVLHDAIEEEEEE